MTDEEFDARQAAHQRRLALMRIEGEINRQESHVYLMWVLSAVLGALAIAMMVLV